MLWVLSSGRTSDIRHGELTCCRVNLVLITNAGELYRSIDAADPAGGAGCVVTLGKRG